MTSTILAVGLEAIGQGVGAEDRVVWQVQVGVTRIGSGGRALPRCRSGRMATSAAVVASTIEPVGPQVFVVLPRRAKKIVVAPLARTIAFLTVAVVVAGIEIARRGLSMLASIGRVVEWTGAKLAKLGTRILAAIRPSASRHCYCCA